MSKRLEYDLRWPHLGNEQATQFLVKSLERGNIANVYLFVGPDDVGKTTLANSFAASLLCGNYVQGGILPCGECSACRQNQIGKPLAMSHDLASVHPDFHLLKRLPDKKNIGVEQVRGFINALQMSSFLNSFKIGIVKQAERLSDEAANALLKTLEEPRERVVVILIAKELESLPSTIVSRAQIVRFYPVKTEVIYHYLLESHNVSRSQALHLSRLALGRPALAVKFLEDQRFYQEYLKRIEAFLMFGRQPVYERWLAVAGLFGEKSTGPEASRRAERILESWQGVIRDLILAYYGHLDLIQHEVAIDRIEQVAKLATPDKMLVWLNRFSEARSQLRANVAPKNVLEQLVSLI